jgi:hypothetical protein
MSVTNLSRSVLAGAAVCLACCLHLITRRLKQKSRGDLPPGPPRYWGIGNLLSVPTKYQWLQFTQWKDQYGKTHVFLLHERIHLHENGNR